MSQEIAIWNNVFTDLRNVTGTLAVFYPTGKQFLGNVRVLYAEPLRIFYEQEGRKRVFSGHYELDIH